jgi:hydroxylaminobenzene mutase
MMREKGQSLLALGVVLFMLGLLSGFAIQAMANPRMGLAGYLEGVMNGTFLMVVGVAWVRLNLSARLESVTYWLVLYGTYANLLFVQMAAIFGTSRTTPIAGAGYQGLPWQESLVSIGLISVGITMVLACALMIWGFVQRDHDDA